MGAESPARRHLTLDDEGGYLLIDGQMNAVVAGGRFDLDLDGVEDYLWRAG